MIFYAGHGEQEGKSFYLLPQDVDVARLAATGISGEVLKQHLGEMPGKILLLLDACHSGAIGKVVNEMARDLADEDCGVVVMLRRPGQGEGRRERWPRLLLPGDDRGVAGPGTEELGATAASISIIWSSTSSTACRR